MSVMPILAVVIAGCGPLLYAQAQSANPEFDFAREIGTILTRKGCNGASCHGGVKGRGGFKLSPGAFHPKEDYEWIVKGGTYQVLTTEVKGERIPRVEIAEPEKSLLLLKATGAVSHGGGKRFAPESPEYGKLIAWIRSGAPFGRETHGRKIAWCGSNQLRGLSLLKKAAPAGFRSPRISPTDEPRL